MKRRTNYITACMPEAGRSSLQGAFGILLCVLGTCAIVVPGCSDATKRQWKYRSPQENLRNALEAQHADLRRDAVVRIGESGYFNSENAFGVLDAVARTDPQPQIRCIAIRALARYRDDRPVDTLLAILQATPGDQRALPANDDLRWEAALALMLFEERGLLAEKHRQATCSIYLEMLGPARPRRLRIAAVAALGSFKDRRVFPPLISAVRDRDFAVADCAERSLIKLTGTTHSYDADAWARWVAATADPFANAGYIPPTTRPAGPSWWDKQVRAWRRGLKLSYD